MELQTIIIKSSLCCFLDQFEEIGLDSILPPPLDVSEDSLLFHALEELNSCANSPNAPEESQPASPESTVSSLSASDLTDPLLGQFLDLDAFLGLEEPTETTMSPSGTPDLSSGLSEIIASASSNHSEDSLEFSENAVDMLLPFTIGYDSNPVIDGVTNVPTGLQVVSDTTELVSSSVSIDNKNSDAAVTSTSTISLEELLNVSGINVAHLPNDSSPGPATFDEDKKPNARKRKCEDDETVQSPKSIKSEDDNSSTGCCLSPKASLTEEEKIVHRRNKNNAASRVSRAARKARHQDLFKKVVELEQENASLRIKIEEMTKEAEQMRSVLIGKLSGANP